MTPDTSPTPPVADPSTDRNDFLDLLITAVEAHEIEPHEAREKLTAWDCQERAGRKRARKTAPGRATT